MTTKHDGCAVCVAVKEVLVYISLYACVPRWVQFSLTWVQSNRIVFQLGGMSTTSMEFNCEPRKVGPKPALEMSGNKSQHRRPLYTDQILYVLGPKV